MHWFSEHDPITFWDAFDCDDLDAEFRVIRDDGFNTLFLLLPWHAFFPDNSAVLDSWHRERLTTVLNAAKRTGLQVVGRLFYAHSAARGPDQRLHERQYHLLRNPGAAAGLAAQAQAFAASVTGLKAWRGAFVCWEDFWPVFEGPPHWDLAPRLAVSQSSGFSAFVDQAIAHEPGTRTHLERHGDTWAIPTHRSKGMAWWIRFFGEFFNQRVIQACAPAFPALGAEVRVDAYPIPNDEGDWGWQHFDLHDNVPGQRFAYWGVYYDQQNQGEKLSASQAVRGLSALLDRFPADSPPVIDQLNFRDTTLHFATTSAAMADAVIPEFLAQCGILLKQRHCGYALWAWRDYRENWVTNPTFQRGGSGWQSSLGKPNAAPSRLQLRPQEKVWQTVVPAYCAQAAAPHYAAFFIDVQCLNIVSSDALALQVNNVDIALHASGNGYLQWCIPADIVTTQTLWNGGIALQLRSRGDVTINIRKILFWGFTQALGVRDAYGNAGCFLDPVRNLNEFLTSQGHYSL